MELATGLNTCNTLIKKYPVFLISSSTDFISRTGDGVNPEESIDVGNTIQKKTRWESYFSNCRKKVKGKTSGIFSKIRFWI